ncbi:MAG: cytochrome-c oxidase, cbb3-type subunit II [Hyphomicrobiaceae bacterium]
MAFNHGTLERHSLLLIVGILLMVSVGGLVQLVPLFYLDSTIEEVKGMRPYSPLELAGRDIYMREGCYVCHTQMIRSLRDEVERYGHYSLAAESMYDHPFQWGSKRTGPDLARVGGKYSDDWHVAHMTDPRSVVPESIMPSYPWLKARTLDVPDIAERLKTLRAVGVPYTDEQIASASQDLVLQANPDEAGSEGVAARYPKAVVRAFDGEPGRLTELDAVVAYLQMLGTLVDFASFDESGPNLR